ncbi:MAG: phenylalanine--tRNA ligase subunit beta [Bacteroidetes bacterium]|nr:phenylalanine--tRNA ligase subunit beta [Bacteroidota bacterium]
MRIHYNYLAQFVSPLPNAEQAAEILTRVGLEVEGIEKVESVKGGLQDVVVGHVIDVVPHPDADRLRITQVNVGADVPLQIVCGAPNVAVDQKVLVALVGATLYPGGGDEALKIKKSKIRGVGSMGMICAEDELGIGTSHDGIMVLSENATIGTPAAEYLQLSAQEILEIGLTPNRTDAMSHYGVARELIAGANGEIKSNSFLQKINHLPKIGHGDWQLSVSADTQCKRYSLLHISINPQSQTPDWMKKSMEAIGLKCIHPVVDITNWVQHELGQPMHAFDAQWMRKEMVIRNANDGEVLTTLDGVERKLNTGDVIIANDTQAACLAGVMGGSASGVHAQTTEIYLECALFDAVRVRKSARHHGIHSDSSFRFERGVDPEMFEMARARAVELLVEYCGAEVKSMQEKILQPFERTSILFHSQKACTLIGKQIPDAEMQDILRHLEFGIEVKTEKSWMLQVPGCRVDVTREIDVIEEILRVYGFDQVDPSAQFQFSWQQQTTSQHQRKNQLAEMLCSMGLTEIQSLSLTKNQYSETEDTIRIVNPLSQDLGIMRREIIHSGLETIALNINRKQSNVAIFELGNVYSKNNSGYQEELTLGIWLTGQNEKIHAHGTAQAFGFRHLRFYAEQLFQLMSQNLTEGKAIEKSGFSECAQYEAKKVVLNMGKVSQSLLKLHDIKQPVYFLSLNADAFFKAMERQKMASADLSKYPAVRRDLALLVNETVKFQDIQKAALQNEKKLLRDVFLFDVYQGDKLPQGKKSYAVGFVLQDQSATLTDTQIEKTMERIQKGICEPLGAELRG